MSSNWRVQLTDGGEGIVLSVDAHAFIKSFKNIPSISLDYSPKYTNSILVVGFSLDFQYNDPALMPEICDMLADVNFINLYDDPKDTQSDRTELYEKAAIIRVRGCWWVDNYAGKGVPRKTTTWSGEYNNHAMYVYVPGLDLSRVKNISFHKGAIPDNIGDYHFHYVGILDITDVDIMSKINTNVLDINIETDNLPENWYRLLENVKYFILRVGGTISDVPMTFTCDKLLAYEVSDCNSEHVVWDNLDEVCEANRPKPFATKSARS